MQPLALGHLGSQALPVRLIWPVIGLLISGWVLHYLKVTSVGMPNEVVVHYHGPPVRVSLKEDSLKALACVATVGLGASLGLGGPSQWLGTRVAIYIDHLFRRVRWLRGIPRRQMILVGAAAGVSAIFRAPLAGALLALETPYSKDIDGPTLFPASVAAFAGPIAPRKYPGQSDDMTDHSAPGKGLAAADRHNLIGPMQDSHV